MAGKQTQLIRSWWWSGRQSYGLVLPHGGQISPYRKISASASVSKQDRKFLIKEDKRKRKDKENRKKEKEKSLLLRDPRAHGHFSSHFLYYK